MPVGTIAIHDMDRDKRQRFVELGETRVRKAAQMLRLIGNLSNTSNYEYSPDDAQKILSALDTEMKLLRAKFQAALSRRTKDEFKLGS
jgi:mitochondrial fission protein ELM1